MTLCQKENGINELREDFLHAVIEILNWLNA